MSTAKGVKLDAGKPAVVRGCLSYFPLALKAVAAVSEFGATKYTWDGWESVENGVERYTEALGRHLLDIKKGVDTDSGLSHRAHLAWNALASLELAAREAMEGVPDEDEDYPLDVKAFCHPDVIDDMIREWRYEGKGEPNDPE